MLQNLECFIVLDFGFEVFSISLHMYPLRMGPCKHGEVKGMMKLKAETEIRMVH